MMPKKKSRRDILDTYWPARTATHCLCFDSHYRAYHFDSMSARHHGGARLSMAPGRGHIFLLEITRGSIAEFLKQVRGRAEMPYRFRRDARYRLFKIRESGLRSNGFRGHAMILATARFRLLMPASGRYGLCRATFKMMIIEGAFTPAIPRLSLLQASLRFATLSRFHFILHDKKSMFLWRGEGGT